MKPLWTIAVAAILAGTLVSACSRQHSTPYHGVATEMNFGRQVINPNAPAHPELPAEVSVPIGESIYKRHADTYDKPVPDCLFDESCDYGTGPTETTTETTTTGLK